MKYEYDLEDMRGSLAMYADDHYYEVAVGRLSAILDDLARYNAALKEVADGYCTCDGGEGGPAWPEPHVPTCTVGIAEKALTEGKS